MRCGQYEVLMACIPHASLQRKQYIMRNISAKVEKGELVLRIKLDQNLGMSGSGKNVIVASTGGNQVVEGTGGMKLGLNLFKAPDAKAA